MYTLMQYVFDFITLSLNCKYPYLQNLYLSSICILKICLWHFYVFWIYVFGARRQINYIRIMSTLDSRCRQELKRLTDYCLFSTVNVDNIIISFFIYRQGACICAYKQYKFPCPTTQNRAEFPALFV